MRDEDGMWMRDEDEMPGSAFLFYFHHIEKYFILLILIVGTYIIVIYLKYNIGILGVSVRVVFQFLSLDNRNTELNIIIVLSPRTIIFSFKSPT